jgi:hypothetical protein
LGDEMTTYGSSSADTQTLDGRGTVHLGEFSKIKLEEDTPQGQVLRLVQGKIYSAVEKMDVYADMLQEKTKQFGSDFLTVANVSEKEYEAVIKSLRARAQKRFEVRTPSFAMSVRGTRFSFELKNGEATKIAVFEGSVEAGEKALSFRPSRPGASSRRRARAGSGRRPSTGRGRGGIDRRPHS